jgi:type I restriction enzyme S subunit
MIPEGWATVPLGEVVEPVPNVKPEDEPDRMFGYVDISSIDNSAYKIVDYKKFTGRDAPSRARRPIQSGDVLFSNVRTYLRNIAIVPPGGDLHLCSTGFTVLRPTGALDNRYLFRYLLTDDFIDRVTPKQTGTHYPATSDRAILAETVPIPPSGEQKRIATKVEELLARVNAARERLARVPVILKRFRQAVLASACSGRLTADWRALSSHEWEVCQLGGLIVGGPQNGLYKPRSAYGEGSLIVRIDNFYDGHIQAWNRLDRLRLTEQEAAVYELRNGDILVNRVNSLAFLGKSALVANLQEPCVFESNMMRFRVDSERVSAHYLINYLTSPQGLAELRKNAKHAVNQASINQKDVADVFVPLPQLSEQHEIVNRVEALFRLAETIEKRVGVATARAEKLTQAVLAKAFRGELVPTEAELARREGRGYEPASVLLERIRAERGQAAASTRAEKSRGRSRGR